MSTVGIMEGSEGVIGDKNRSHTGKVWQSLSFEHSNDLRPEGLEIVALLGTIAFFEQANKVLSKWHG